LDTKIPTKKDRTNKADHVVSSTKNLGAKPSFQKDLTKKKIPLPTPTTASPVTSSGSKSVSKKGESKKSTTNPTNAAKNAAVLSSDSKDDNTSDSSRKRSGNRVVGHANSDSSKEIRQKRDRAMITSTTRTIVRNNYIIVDPPSANYNDRYSRSGGSGYSYYPPRNPGTAYYYNDYAPPLQEQQAYPPYRRTIAPTSKPKQQQLPSSACGSDLPLESEPVDVLVDPTRGLYVQGGVTSVDRSNCDFTVTYWSADGYQVKKSFKTIAGS
jgi:hypothetical protein